MRSAGKESIRYALLLVLLLATGAVAVSVTLNYLDVSVPDSNDRLILSMIIWTLTLGFMLIAGAFGLWAIHFAAASEGIRRVSQFVESMDFIRDGILAYDRHSNITAMNPAAKRLFQPSRPACLADILPELESFARDLPHGQDAILEREFQLKLHDTPQTLRFRAQPGSDDISLLLISDITALALNRTRQRRAASIQLAGHLAQGIANDFNDLLCGISGHLSMLERTLGHTGSHLESLTAMQHCANRGIRLARQLIQLSSQDAQSPGSTTFNVAPHINIGLDLLASSLDASWQIDRQIEAPVPPVNLPPAQLEHLVHSLGLIVAETVLQEEHHLCVRLTRGSPKTSPQLDSPVAGQLEILALPETTVRPATAPMQEEGVVSALAQTLISQAGGHLAAIPSGRRTRYFCISLPQADPAIWKNNQTEEPLAIGLEAYTAGWQVLLCLPAGFPARVSKYLESKQLKLASVQNEGDLLASVTADTSYDAIFLHEEVLAANTVPLARVVQRLSPHTGIILLPQAPPQQETPFLTLSPDAYPPQWIHAMIEARSRLHTTPAKAPDSA